MHNERITVEIKEKLPQPELARYLSQCKVFVFLSRKEGDNKALVEAMFADLPSIVYARSIGGARNRINPATGVLAEDEELAQKIRYMLDNYRNFTPRTWALANTGSEAATRILDGVLAGAARAGGAPYTRSIVEKTNAPNLGYKQPEQRASFAADYDFVTSCLLKTRS
jgi:glycosyltransferase involved in cell wall biosynthesis